jgi:hypothetical protein
MMNLAESILRHNHDKAETSPITSRDVIVVYYNETLHYVIDLKFVDNACVSFF